MPEQVSAHQIRALAGALALIGLPQQFVAPHPQATLTPSPPRARGWRGGNGSPCPNCSKVFAGRIALKSHVKAKHGASNA